MDKKKNTNRLIHETSPYLLQHANNPVNWIPWSDDVFKIAKKEDKLVIISIGYSACHWCHVMEHESFENEDIANIMNDHFISVKVDREEHPDVDQVYMTAVQLITGSGGWPLNCITLPDGRPVYGGTYFRAEQWKHILTSLFEQYKKDKERFLRSAESIQNGIEQSEFEEFTDDDLDFKPELIQESVMKTKRHFDKIYGGFNRAPKFPLPSFWSFLLEYSYYSNDIDTLDQVYLSLNKMASGGIYDQLGGGFARYSVDAHWIVPHFEKMLYDNAQLISLYSNAYQFSGNKLYKKIVIQTIEFIEREMCSPEGGFYSAYDADSEGTEGKYYVWKKDEIDSILKKRANLFCEFFSIEENGNWESNENILYRTIAIKDLSDKFGLSETEIEIEIDQSIQTLLNERNKRIKPGLDDKIITSWNAMMIGAYLDAYRVFNDETYLGNAVRSAEFLKQKLFKQHSGSEIFRTYKNELAKIDGLLDDYAFTIDAFIKLFQETGNEEYAITARNLTSYVLEHFSDTENVMFFYASDVNFNLIVRQKEVSDNVIPASNSVMAENLYKIGLLFSDNFLIDRSMKMIKAVEKNISQNTEYFGNWASMYLLLSEKSFELVITGENEQTIKDQILNEFRPDIFYASSKIMNELPIFLNRFKDGETVIYVCEKSQCKLPVKTAEEAINLLTSK
jgi:uncharacterized protein YyaL (SSP411 family)